MIDKYVKAAYKYMNSYEVVKMAVIEYHISGLIVAIDQCTVVVDVYSEGLHETILRYHNCHNYLYIFTPVDRK